jgi:hypothetical protein
VHGQQRFSKIKNRLRFVSTFISSDVPNWWTADTILLAGRREEEEEEAETTRVLRLGDIGFFPSGEWCQLEVRSAFPRVEFANGTSQR